MLYETSKPITSPVYVAAHYTSSLKALNGFKLKLEMWANAQRDGRPAKYRWHLLFNAAVWLTPTTRVPYSNAAETRNPLKLPGVPQTNETISAASGPSSPYCADM